jgi:integrase
MPTPAKKRCHTPRPRPRKDGSICWQVRYTINRNGRPVATSQPFDDEAAAVRWAALLDRVGPERAESVLAAQLATSSAAELTIGEWLRRYAARLTGIEEATRKKYVRFIERDIDEFMGALPLAAYTEDLDAAWVSYLVEEVGNAAKTVVNKHGFVSAGMAAAARHRPEPLIPATPCAHTRLPRVAGRRREFFTAAEYELFEALLYPKYRPMFEFMVMSMCRPGEVFALTVGDIDAETGAVRIDKAWKYANGRRLLGLPKSDRGIRTAYVPLDTIDRLELDRPADELLFSTGVGTAFTVTGFYRQIWQPAQRRLDALADIADPGRNLFGRMAHWTGDTPEQLLARFGRATVEGLLAKWITPYTTRHTGISWRLQDGVPIWVVSRDAGHESIQTTDRKYGHIDNSASRNAAELAAGRLPKLRNTVVGIDFARRCRLVREGKLGEIDRTAEGFEAVWMDSAGLVRSRVFAEYGDAVEHVARYEAGETVAVA